MGVISGLFERLAARIPDQTQGKNLLNSVLKADPTHADSKARATQAGILDHRNAAALLLNGMLEDAIRLGDALEKIHTPVRLKISQEEEFDNEEEWWKGRTTSATVTLSYGDKRILSFKASLIDEGGYYLEIEHNRGNEDFSVASTHRHPVNSFAEVEEALAQSLESAFNIPEQQTAHVLNVLAKAIDIRPQQFLETMETKTFTEVLNYIENGIDAGHVYTEYAGQFRPLDFILMSRHPGKIEQDGPEPFTDEQRRQLFEAVVRQANDPGSLFSSYTMHKAASHSCANLIPRLIELGCNVEDKDFINVGDNCNDEQKNLTTYKALRPYIKDVNVTSYDSNAGINAAMRGDYASFLWLEKEGLDKTVTHAGNLPTYVHQVACGSSRANRVAAKGRDGWPKLLEHLIDNGYPFDSQGRIGTPLDVATENGHLDLAKILLDKGAKPTSSTMANVASAVFGDRLPASEAIQFMKDLHEKHALPYPQEAAEKIFSIIRTALPHNFFNARWETLQPLADIASFLATQGIKPMETKELAELRSSAALKLRGGDPSALRNLGIDVLPPVERTPRPRPSAT